MSTFPGLLRWTPIPGATAYQIWLPARGKRITTLDERRRPARALHLPHRPDVDEQPPVARPRRCACCTARSRTSCRRSPTGPGASLHGRQPAVRRRPASACWRPSRTRSPTRRSSRRRTASRPVSSSPAIDDVRRARRRRRSRALPRLRVHRQRLRQHRLHGLGRRLAGLGAARRRDNRPPRFTVRDRLRSRQVSRRAVRDRRARLAQTATRSFRTSPGRPPTRAEARRRRRPRRIRARSHPPRRRPPRRRSPRRRSPPWTRTTRRPQRFRSSSPRTAPRSRRSSSGTRNGRRAATTGPRRVRPWHPSRSRHARHRRRARGNDDQGRGHGRPRERATSSRSGSRPRWSRSTTSTATRHPRSADSPALTSSATRSSAPRTRSSTRTWSCRRTSARRAACTASASMSEPALSRSPTAWARSSRGLSTTGQPHLGDPHAGALLRLADRRVEPRRRRTRLRGAVGQDRRSVQGRRRSRSTTCSTSAVLPLKPGTWYYRVRGINLNMPAGAQGARLVGPDEDRRRQAALQDRQGNSSRVPACTRTWPSRSSWPTSPTRSRFDSLPRARPSRRDEARPDARSPTPTTPWSTPCSSARGGAARRRRARRGARRATRCDAGGAGSSTRSTAPGTSCAGSRVWATLIALEEKGRPVRRRRVGTGARTPLVGPARRRRLRGRRADPRLGGARGSRMPWSPYASLSDGVAELARDSWHARTLRGLLAARARRGGLGRRRRRPRRERRGTSPPSG